MPFAPLTNSPVQLNLSRAAACVLALGFSARIYLFYQIPIISPDSHLYIQQAKALYFGLFDQILSCYSYLSPYPVAVCAAYRIFGDWVIAAQSVNIFFSTLTIIPFYWLLRRFFDDTVASLTALVFALLPAYTFVSTDALRDPLFWFFSVSGLYLFILHIEKRRPGVLLCCSFCLAFATWARIEGSLYILVTACYLPFIKNRNRWTDLLIFLTPYIILLFMLIGLASGLGLNWVEILNPKRILNLPLGVISQYEGLRNELKTLYQPDLFTVSKYFFDRIRSLVWIIALVALIVLIVETLLYIFFGFLLAGAVSLGHSAWTDKRIRYIAFICISALGLLYFQTFCAWHAAERHLAVFLLPAFIFIGAGIKRFHLFLSNRFRCRPATGYAVVCALVLLTVAPKIIRANYDADKLIFREIGLFISQRETGQRAVSVCGAFKRVTDVHFYANVNTPWAPCFDTGALFYRTKAELLQFIQNQKYDYFIWDQAGWQHEGITPSSVNSANGFHNIREWHSKKLGRLILYEVILPSKTGATLKSINERQP
ncbi:MAG: glycosyltransferase family 39 protein [Desulfobacterales bacterium]|nr:glycosyltransferase family 39 protein [Desulfobacterales bacterium]